MSFYTIEEAIADLKQGRIIIVVDDEDRENEGDFVGLAEKVTPDMINFMITHGRGLVCVPITQERADQLELPPMVYHNADPRETAFTVSVDASHTHTGISAHERAETIRSLIDVSKNSKDFNRPGHVFPLITRPGGVLRRAGHTEAAVDLARLCNTYPAGVICEILKEDGTMARVPDLIQIAQSFDMKMITIQDLIHYRRKKETLVKRVVSVQMPTDFGEFEMVGFLDHLENREHVAFVKGTISSEEPVLVRVHSECLTGDVFSSKRCDCGVQLQAALKRIEEEGRGILLYMRQEGRGIGLINKLKAYKLQEQGLDTVDANLRLGFADDLREYGIGAQMLRDLGVRKMRLLTNNPRKIAGLKGYNLEVTEVLSIEFPTSEENRKYMETKKTRLGHLLHL